MGESTHPEISAPRYSDLPFPPYRFVPGKHPHPTAHPQGHSYLAPGESEPRAPFVPPEQWYASEAYLFGCDLYNHGYWWEAHEAWEGLWRSVPRGTLQRHFLQGLIQLSACHLKRLLGHAEGVSRLRATSSAHLERVLAAGEDRFMGLELRLVMERFNAYYDAHAGHAAAAYPYLRPGPWPPARGPKSGVPGR